MSVAGLYREIAEDREARIKSLIPEARLRLSRYSFTFHDSLLGSAMYKISYSHKIDLAFEESEAPFLEKLTEKELLNCILGIFINTIDNQLGLQYSWRNSNDCPQSDPTKEELKNQFCSTLVSLINNSKHDNLDEKIELSKNLINKFSSYDLNQIKDLCPISFIQTCIDCFRLVGMIISGHLFFDARISHKCYNGNSFSNIFSRKTLYDHQLEKLTLQIQKLEQLYTCVPENTESPFIC